MQRWTKWLHTTKLLLESAWMYFTVKDLLDYPCHHQSHTHTTGQDTLKSNQTVIVFLLLLKKGTYLLFVFVVPLLSFFPFILFFFTTKSIEGSWKLCLRIHLAIFNPGFKTERTFFVFFFRSSRYPESAHSGMRSTQRVTQWILLWFLIIFFLFAGISVCSLGCSVELSADFFAILSGLHIRSSTSALCWEVTLKKKRLLLVFYSKGIRHCKTLFRGNDFMTCFLCVKSHVKYSVFWMELCFSSNCYLTVCFWVKYNGTFTCQRMLFLKKKEKKKKPKEKKLQSCLPCKRNLEFIL